MAEFSCWIYLVNRYKDGEYTLQRHVTLPFAPFIGLCLNFDDDKADFATIRTVDYVPKDDVFWCWCVFEAGADCPCGPNDKCCVVGNSVAEYAEMGWELFMGPDMLKDSDYPDLYRKKWQFTGAQLGIKPRKKRKK